VRCLQSQPGNNPSDVTRDYKFLLEFENNTLPLLTVIGGKLTTFRNLAEDALSQLKSFFPQMKPEWTASASLPGGDFKNHDFNLFYQQLKSEYSWIPEPLLYRYAKNYGTRVYLLLNKTYNINDLGENLGADLYQKEVDYLKREEWAQTHEDILWRRTKLGLFL
jgi:glycerol-3-phosphate dehydrogenase